MAFDRPKSSARLLRLVQQGDPEAARLLFARYTVRLTALVRARLSKRLRARIDPEDIVQSAWRSFFVGARNTRWTLAGDELWPLLAMITVRKLARQAGRHSRGRRDIRMETPLDAIVGLPDDATPPPEAVFETSDAIEALLDRLDPLATEVVLLKLRGHDTDAVEQLTGASARTIRRIVEEARRGFTDSTEDGEALLDLNVVVQAMEESPVTESSTTEADGGTPEIPFSSLLLHQMVGRGGFGKVYKATLREADQIVAVKFLKKSFWSDAEAVTALLRETETVSAIRHPNVIRHYGRGRTPSGIPYLVMEFIGGGDIQTWVRRERPGLVSLLNRIADVADTLSIIHAVGIIHGDLTPSNVLIDGDRTVLTDFGFSRSARQPANHGGTPGFAAPEQISGVFGPVGVWTDIYGIGGLLYALLTGRPPYEGASRDDVVAGMLCGRPIAPMTLEDSTVLAPLNHVVRSCLESEPVDRPVSMASVAHELRRIALNASR